MNQKGIDATSYELVPCERDGSLQSVCREKKTAKISVCLSLLLCIQNTNAPEAVELEISSAESCWDAVAPCAITHTVLLHKK